MALAKTSEPSLGGSRRSWDCVDLPATRPLSWRRRLVALLAALSLGSLVILGSSADRLFARAGRTQAEREVAGSAAAGEFAIRREIAGIEAAVQSAATSAPLLRAVHADPAAFDRTAIRATLEQLVTSTGSIGIAGLVDARGFVVDVLPETPAAVGKDYSGRDWYTGAQARGGPYVSEAYESASAGGGRVVAIAVPVREDDAAGGRTVAVLVAGYRLDEIQHFVDDLAKAHGVTFSVTDQRGVRVARSGPVSVDANAADPAVARALRGRADTAIIERGGRELVASHRPVEGIGWTVSAELPLSRALGPTQGIRNAVLLVTIVLALLIAVGLLVLDRSLRKREKAEEELASALLDVRRDIDVQHAQQIELARAREVADQASAAKSEFLSRMSHELRTPLHAVLGFGQLLELDELQSEQKDNVDQIIRAGHHLLGLIDEVLDISRIESGRLRLAMEPVCLADVVDEAVHMLRTLAADRSVAIIDHVCRSRDVYVRADRQRLKQVVVNLLANAVKYNVVGGTVDVRPVAAGSGLVRLLVSDSGIGIRSEDIGRLFLPFERIDGPSSKVEGAGLGLALSRSLVRAMDGEIGLTSTFGSGSTFWVELPASAAPVAPPVAIPPVTERMTAASGRRTVLYVEDDLANVRLVERLLARVPEVTLHVARSGAAGIATAAACHPDVILLDLHLGDMHGEAVLQALRADPLTALTPVVTVSADAGRDRAQRLWSLGVTGQLVKPFELAKLLAAINVKPMRPVVAHHPQPPTEILDHAMVTMLHSLELSGDAGKDVRGIIDTFLGDAATRVEEVATAMRSGDIAVALEVLHTLSGSCANFAAVRAAAAARILHAALTEGRVDAAPELARLEAALGEARRALEAEFATGDRAGSSLAQ